MEILYSYKLKEMFDICIVDGVCIKSRGKDPEKISKEDIEKAKENYDNILIQDKKKILIFCSKKKSDDFLSLAYSDKCVGDKYKECIIKVNHN